MLLQSCIFGDPETEEDKITNGYLILAFSGTQKRAEMLHNTCIPGDIQTKDDKIRNGCPTLASSEALNGVEMLHHRTLGGLKQKKTNLEMAASPLPSAEPKRGRKCYVIDAFSDVAKQKNNQTRLPHLPVL